MEEVGQSQGKGHLEMKSWDRRKQSKLEGYKETSMAEAETGQGAGPASLHLGLQWKLWSFLNTPEVTCSEFTVREAAGSDVHF